MLKFGGGWVDVKICLFFGRVAWLPASREVRLERLVSDCVAASKAWGCVDGCPLFFVFLRVHRVVAFLKSP